MTPTNPSKAYHPTCLAIVFDFTPPPDSRKDKATTAQDINTSFTSKGIPPNLKIIAIGISRKTVLYSLELTRLLPVLPFVSELPNVIAPGHNRQVREDKK